MKRLCHSVMVLLIAGILWCGGCSNGNTEKSLWRQLKDVGGQKSDLAIRLEKLEQENEQLRNQVKTLQGLDPNERLAAVDVLDKIAIGSRTGLYDKDGDGRKESLVVYIEPADIAGDRVKAAGRVHVRLWNLNAENSQNALLKEWKVEPAELKECWAATLMTHYYRLTLKVEDILKGDETGLAIKVKFVDYVSGKVLEDQRAIK